MEALVPARPGVVITCPKCYGEGEDIDGERCTRCEGECHLVCDDHCPTCGGTAEVLCVLGGDDPERPCPNAHAAGRKRRPQSEPGVIATPHPEAA